MARLRRGVKPRPTLTLRRAGLYGPPETSRARQCECDQLSRILSPRDGADDELLAASHVGHGRVADARRQLHLPDNLAGLLVERAEHLAAVAGRYADAAVAAFTHEHQRLRRDRRIASGRAERWQLQPLERRVIAQAVAVGDLPDNVPLV